MRSAAFTMVQNHMVILGLWLKYYSQWFDDLYVIGNGTKATYGDLDPLKEQYHFTFERVGFKPSSTDTLPIVTEMQHKLVKEYDWVLYSDCDEIITPNLYLYKDFRAFFRAFPDDKVLCEGFNILEEEYEKPIDFSKPYLQQRKYWYKNWSYNKPLLARVPLYWAEGCHRELDVHDTIGKLKTCTGMYLIHLKYADMKPMQPRDLGPVITQIEGGTIEKGRNEKVEIPERIRNII